MGDIELNYIEKGSGFPLVLLHGNGESSGIFSNQLEEFSDRFRVIAVDTRGHGESPRGTAPFTLEQFAEDLKAFFDEHCIKKAHLLGFSDGGNIALLFALKYPEYIEKLIINGADLCTRGVKPVYQIPITLGFALVSLIFLFDKKAIVNREILSLMVGQPNIKPSELAALKMPVLVIAGTKDMIKESHTRLIAESIENSTLCFIEGDHFIAVKKCDEFNRKIASFLALG